MFDITPGPGQEPDSGGGPELEEPLGLELAELLMAVPLGEVDAEGVAAVVAGWQRVVSWAQAEQAAAAAELTRREEMRPTTDAGHASVHPVTVTAAEMAARLKVTARQAENLVGEAVQVVEDFPATWEALRAGDIDHRRVRVILDELSRLKATDREHVETKALQLAPEVDATGLRRRVKRLAHALAPVSAAERCRQARADRRVTLTAARDGMAWLEAYLPGEDAQAIWTTIDAAAVSAKQDDAAHGCAPRTADQRRADALAQLAWTALAQHNGAPADTPAANPADTAPPAGLSAAVTAAWPSIRLGSMHGRPVTVHVTVPLSTLAGMDEQPGEVRGYGPIPADAARELAAAGVWQWVGAHPVTGHMLNYGRSRYRPTQALVDFLLARDQTCRAPGCHRPAHRCDIDHVRPFHHGGQTSPDNTVVLCRKHHLLKHHTHWRLTHAADPDIGTGAGGGHVWTSPTGRQHLKPPEPTGPTSGETPSRSPDHPPPEREPLPDDDPPPF